MSTSQITSNPPIPEELSPRLKRKLEAHLRATTGRRKTEPKKRGRKPAWANHLSRARSSKALDELDAIASPALIYSELVAAKQWAQAWNVRESVENRVLGRPFVAINPAESKLPALQDNRLQVAIQNLILPANQKKAKKKGNVITDAHQPVLELAGEVQTPIQAGAKAAGGQEK